MECRQYTLATIDSNERRDKPSMQVGRESAGKNACMTPRVAPLCIFQMKVYLSMSLCRARIECCTRWHPSTTYQLSKSAYEWIRSRAQHPSIHRMTTHTGMR